MVKAVIFDMDGLMIDTEKLLVKYWLEAAHYYGYPMKREHILKIRSLAAKYAVPRLQAELGKDFDYYESKEDLLAKIDYYLSHEDERQAIAGNGHDKIAAAHTYRHRVREMLDRFQ